MEPLPQIERYVRRTVLKLAPTCRCPQPIPEFNLKTTFFCSYLCLSALIAGLGANHTFAQAPARPDKIMTIDELRACLALKSGNEKAGADILREQQTFTRDQDAVKAEQPDVDKGTLDIRARSAALAAEREAISALVSALSAKAPTLKTDAEKADYETERAKLVLRSRLYSEDSARFNTAQQTHSDRVNALNERINAINARSVSINDGIEPHQQKIATWRNQCSNRRFREEDEIAIKKELAAGK